MAEILRELTRREIERKNAHEVARAAILVNTEIVEAISEAIRLDRNDTSISCETHQIAHEVVKMLKSYKLDAFTETSFHTGLPRVHMKNVKQWYESAHGERQFAAFDRILEQGVSSAEPAPFLERSSRKRKSVQRK